MAESGIPQEGVTSFLLIDVLYRLSPKAQTEAPKSTHDLGWGGLLSGHLIISLEHNPPYLGI